MQVTCYAQRIEAATERFSLWLSSIMGDNYAANINAHARKDIHQTKNIFIVGNAEVTANFV